MNVTQDGESILLPGWEDILKMDPVTRLTAIRNAAWHAWSFMHAQATGGKDPSFERGKIVFSESGKPRISTSGDGLDGWLWSGIFGWTLESLWPDLANYTHHAKSLKAGRAVTFRRSIGRYLKYSANVVCLSRGSMQSTPPVYPIWFVREEWNPEAPAMEKYTTYNARPEVEQRDEFSASPPPPATRQKPAKSTPPPGEVKTTFTCRVTGCGRRYSYEGNRDAHERKDHSEEIKELLPGMNCICGDGPFKSDRSFNLHKRICKQWQAASAGDKLGTAGTVEQPAGRRVTESTAGSTPRSTPRNVTRSTAKNTRDKAEAAGNPVRAQVSGGAEAELSLLQEENELLRRKLADALLRLAMLEG